MEDLLNNAFMSFHGKPDYVPVSAIEVTDPRFELDDSRRLALCAKGDGDGVFENPRNRDTTVMVYDYEGHILAQNPRHRWCERMGLRCDYLLHDDRHFVLCEMTRCRERYLGFHNRDGQLVPGKLDHAKDQLFNTLQKLRDVPEINTRIASFAQKTLLFCYRLTANPSLPSSDAMARSHAAFSRPMGIIGNFSQPLPDGFNFEQRLYNNPFVF